MNARSIFLKFANNYWIAQRIFSPSFLNNSFTFLCIECSLFIIMNGDLKPQKKN